MIYLKQSKRRIRMQRFLADVLAGFTSGVALGIGLVVFLVVYHFITGENPLLQLRTWVCQ